MGTLKLITDSTEKALGGKKGNANENKSTKATTILIV